MCGSTQHIIDASSKGGSQITYPPLFGKATRQPKSNLYKILCEMLYWLWVWFWQQGFSVSNVGSWTGRLTVSVVLAFRIFSLLSWSATWECWTARPNVACTYLTTGLCIFVLYHWSCDQSITVTYWSIYAIRFSRNSAIVCSCFCCSSFCCSCFDCSCCGNGWVSVQSDKCDGWFR